MDFKLTGPGKIIGVGNCDLSCHEADRHVQPNSAERSAFNDLCMVFIQAINQAGPIKIEIASENLQSAKVAIQTQVMEARPSVV